MRENLPTPCEVGVRRGQAARITLQRPAGTSRSPPRPRFICAGSCSRRDTPTSPPKCCWPCLARNQMRSDLALTLAPFSVEDLMLKGRNGPFPLGYLAAYHAHMRQSHDAARAVIEDIYAEAAGDPIELAR